MAVAHVGELADHMEQIDEELGLSGRRLSGATDDDILVGATIKRRLHRTLYCRRAMQRQLRSSMPAILRLNLLFSSFFLFPIQSYFWAFGPMDLFVLRR